MIKIVAIEDYLLDTIIDLVQDRRKDVESGATVTDQPVADELSDMDAALNALRNAESRTAWVTDDMGREIELRG